MARRAASMRFSSVASRVMLACLSAFWNYMKPCHVKARRTRCTTNVSCLSSQMVPKHIPLLKQIRRRTKVEDVMDHRTQVEMGYLAIREDGQWIITGQSFSSLA